MNSAGIEDAPQDDSWFCPVPGRYYLAMWSLEIPARVSMYGNGGDAVFQMWRFENEPAIWHLLYRFRHYRGPRNQIWNSQDEKHWYEIDFQELDEARVLERQAEFYRVLQARTGVTCAPEFLPIRGGMKEFLAALERDKPAWLHIQRTQKG